MESNNKKDLVSSYVVIKSFLRILFEENLIDTDTYVCAMNLAKDEYGQIKKKGY